ncbi:MAG TPA: sensor histidine kinase [Steroidobacteraceae bacterium]|nr:sensor histidine kinase [Steroidobacteraceae bacterium]
MNEGADNLAQARPETSAGQYRRLLEAYVAGVGERALEGAYEIGRRALVEGTPLIDLARIHHQCVATLLASAKSARDSETIVARASEFFAECLPPFEMAYRGFRDASLALRRFNEVLEQEAKRISHSLHDEAGQLLVAVYIELANLAQAHPEAAVRVAKTTGLLDQIEEQLRRLSHELAPAILEDFGLVPALKYLAEGVSQRSGLRISIEEPPAKRLPKPVESVLYRVARESLNNTLRHARATEVSIQFHREESQIFFHIRDNGVGFDVDRPPKQAGEQGFGLIGIRERVESIGGTLHIYSAARAGTELMISVPFGS